MSRLAESMKEAASTVAQNAARTATLKADNRRAALSRRPRLTAETIFQSLDWVMDHHEMLGSDTALYMQAIELGIRTMGNHAQAKDTQHTLVRDGIIDPPPSAS